MSPDRGFLDHSTCRRVRGNIFAYVALAAELFERAHGTSSSHDAGKSRISVMSEVSVNLESEDIGIEKLESIVYRDVNGIVHARCYQCPQGSSIIIKRNMWRGGAAIIMEWAHQYERVFHS